MDSKLLGAPLSLTKTNSSMMIMVALQVWHAVGMILLLTCRSSCVVRWCGRRFGIHFARLRSRFLLWFNEQLHGWIWGFIQNLPSRRVKWWVLTYDQTLIILMWRTLVKQLLFAPWFIPNYRCATVFNHILVMLRCNLLTWLHTLQKLRELFGKQTCLIIIWHQELLTCLLNTACKSRVISL